MALRIFEFSNTRGGVPIRVVPFIASQNHATVDGTSRQSSAFNAASNIITVQTDTDCYLVFGPNPTATSAGYKIAAGQDYDFAVTPGNKVAWITG